MNNEERRDLLEEMLNRLGGIAGDLTHYRAAQLLSELLAPWANPPGSTIDPTIVRRWRNGEREIPAWVFAVLHFHHASTNL